MIAGAPMAETVWWLVSPQTAYRKERWSEAHEVAEDGYTVCGIMYAEKPGMRRGRRVIGCIECRRRHHKTLAAAAVRKADVYNTPVAKRGFRTLIRQELERMAAAGRGPRVLPPMKTPPRTMLEGAVGRTYGIFQHLPGNEGL